MPKWKIDIHVFDQEPDRNKTYYVLRDHLRENGLEGAFVIDGLLALNNIQEVNTGIKAMKLIFGVEPGYDEFKERYLIGRADRIIEQFTDYDELDLEGFEWHLAWLFDDEIDAYPGHWEQYEYEGAGTYECFADYLEHEHADKYDPMDLRTDNRDPGAWYQVHEFLANWLRHEDHRQLVVQIGNMYFWAVQGSGRSIDDDGILPKIYENWKAGYYGRKS